jgi:Tfp pilus assembly protein PilF
MRKVVAVCSLMFVLALSVSAQTPPTNPHAAAEAAFNRGDVEASLKMYDEILAQNPNDVAALIRSAQFLSWRQQFAESVRRYERAIALDPKNSFAQMERAKVLSWSKRLPEALAAFRAIVTADPNNLEAQMGVARVLSWGGDQAAARTAYLRILERNPNNADAALGVAQTYAWTGDQPNARVWYSKVLQIEPSRRDAEVGLAYIDLAEGDRTAASMRASALEKRYPSDKDVRELRSAVNHASAPTFRAVLDHADDVEENEVDYFGVESGFALPRRADLTLGYGHTTLTDALEREGTVQQGFVSLGLRPAPGQRITLRAGAEILERTNGSNTTKPIGLFSWGIGLGRKVEGRLEAERRSVRYTTTALDNGIMVDAYSASILVTPIPSIRLTGAGGVWRFSDTNERTNADAGLSYVWPVKSVRIETGYAYHTFTYDKSLGHGYYDPEDYKAHAGVIDINKDAKFVNLHAYIEGGVQTSTFRGLTSNNDQFLTLVGILGFKVTPLAVLELVGSKSNSAMQNPSGFKSKGFAVRLRLQTR